MHRERRDVNAREVRFVHPDDVGYLCHQFGDCCREKWTIPLTKSEAAALAEVAAAGFEDRLEGRPPTVDLPDGTTTFSRRGRECTFLGDDHRCSLHARRGPESKPDICRLFPYFFTDTPAGMVVGYSFVCRTVRENLSPREHATEEELLPVYEAARREPQPMHYRAVELPLVFERNVELGWDGYAAVERITRALLSDARLTLPRRLVAVDVMGTLLSGYLRLRGGPGPEQNDAAAVDFAAQLEEEKLGTLVRLARLPRPSRLIYRGFSSMLLMLAPGAAPGRLGTFLAWQRLFLRRLPRREPDWTEEETAEIERYLAHVLLRKDLLVGNALHVLGGLRRGLLVLPLLFALIRHYRGEFLADWTPEEATREAILRVERGFGPHARFRRDGVSTHAGSLSLLWQMADNITGRKRFVPSMVLPR